MKTFIGVDPAFRKNGFAICIIDNKDKSIDFKVFTTFVDFFGWLINDSPDEAFFCVENSNLQQVCFRKGQKAAMNAGKNMAVSQLTCDALEAKYTKQYVLGISPKEKGAKITDIKAFDYLLEDHKFTVFNYNSLVSEQDKRDAYQLAYIGMKRFRMINNIKK
jgi:hypothetical protein